MINLSHAEHQLHDVTNFHDLVSTAFHAATNAICWTRKLQGDFAEIVNKVSLTENIEVLDPGILRQLPLSEQGQLAREIMLNDLALLKATVHLQPLTLLGAMSEMMLTRFFQQMSILFM